MQGCTSFSTTTVSGWARPSSLRIDLMIRRADRASVQADLAEENGGMCSRSCELGQDHTSACRFRLSHRPHVHMTLSFMRRPVLQGV